MPSECEVTKEALDVAEPYEAVAPYTTSEVAFSLVVQVTVEVAVAVLDAIAEMTGGVLSVVIEIEEEVA